MGQSELLDVWGVSHYFETGLMSTLVAKMQTPASVYICNPVGIMIKL